MKTLFALCLISVAALTGCLAPNTTTHLKMNAETGDVSWSNPKDTTIQSLSATVATNGTRSIEVTGFSTLNNPQVISSVGAAQANSITATGDAATKIITGLGQVAGTAVGAAAAGAITGK